MDDTNDKVHINSSQKNKITKYIKTSSSVGTKAFWSFRYHLVPLGSKNRSFGNVIGELPLGTPCKSWEKKKRGRGAEKKMKPRLDLDV